MDTDLPLPTSAWATPAVDPSAFDRSAPHQGSSGASLRITRPLRGLIVEDHNDTREACAAFFRYKRWQVEEVTNGEEALAVAASFAPDLVVMDIAMPVMDGIATTRWIKRHPATSGSRVIVLTAHDTRRSEAEGAGCDAFLTKPIDLHELVAIGDALVRGRQTPNVHDVHRRMAHIPPYGRLT
jgi:DNA-binding response OmpR family regulator